MAKFVKENSMAGEIKPISRSPESFCVSRVGLFCSLLVSLTFNYYATWVNVRGLILDVLLTVSDQNKTFANI